MSGRIVCGAGFIASIARAPFAFGSIAPRAPRGIQDDRDNIRRAADVGIGSDGCSRGRSSLADCMTAGTPRNRDPARANARRKIVDEVGQGAQLLAHRGRWARMAIRAPSSRPCRADSASRRDSREIRAAPQPARSGLTSNRGSRRRPAASCRARVPRCAAASGAADGSHRELRRHDAHGREARRPHGRPRR